MNDVLKVLAFFISFIALAAQFALAQAPIRFQEVPGPPVSEQGRKLALPWAGGFNSPQFSAIDLNQDGQPDLFVFDRSSQRVTTFLAKELEGVWQYVHAPQYETSFPQDLFIFALLRDYNQDGKPDLFTASNLGIKVYKNTTPSGGALSFDLAYPVLFYNTDVNLLVGSEDLPAIADMDNDGDLDILMWEWSGSTTLEYFQNQSAELNLPADEMRFTKANSWWGQVTRCVGTCNSYKFGENCPSAHHIGGSSVLPLDLNADGILDLVVGHDDCPDLVSLYNTGTNLLPKITRSERNLPPDITGNQFSVFPAAYYLDVTFDGIPDLVIAPNATSNSHENVDLATSTWVYVNTGTAANPRFEGPKQPFLQNQMLDVGEGAAPALGNLTGGAGPDLLIGNTAILKNNQYAATLSLYQNTGSGFELTDADYLSFSEQNLLYLKPQLLDLNKDGATDLVYSAWNAATSQIEWRYLLNQAPAGAPAQFSASAAQQITGVLFFRGDTPYLYDVDLDGTLDLLVGRASGALFYYRNSGTWEAPVWNLVSESVGGLEANTTRRRLQLIVSDLNQDGKADLLTSDDSGQFRFFSDFAEHLNSSTTAEENVLWQPLTEQFGPANFGKGIAFTTANLDATAGQEVLLGTHAGGIRFLKLILEPLSAKESQPQAVQVQLYPNPAKGVAYVVTEKAAKYTMHNLAGATIAEGKTKAEEVQSLALKNLPAGLYLLRLTFNDGQTTTKKLVIQR